MAATETKHRRGTEAENAAFTGAVGEWIYTTDGKRGYWHDGTTAGGIAVPTAFDLQKSTYIAADISGPDSTGEYSVTLTPTPAAYSEYMIVTGTVAGASVGSDTLNVNGLGGKTIKKNGGADNLSAGDLVSGGVYTFIYDGTDFQLISGSGGGSSDFLGRTTGASGATVDVEVGTWANYAAIQVFVEHLVPANNGTQLYVRLKAGGSYQSSGYHYSYDGYLDDGSPAASSGQSNSGAQILIGSAKVRKNSGDSFATTITIYNPGNATRDKNIVFTGFYGSAVGGITENFMGGGAYQGGTGALTGIRFLMASGNISTMDYTVIGLKQS